MVSVGFPSNSWRFLCRFPIVSDRVSSGLTRVSYGFLQVPSSFLRFPAGFFGVPSAALQVLLHGDSIDPRGSPTVWFLAGFLWFPAGFVGSPAGFLWYPLVSVRSPAEA